MSWLALGLKARGHDVELFLYHPEQGHFRAAIEQADIPITEVTRDGQTGFSVKVLTQLCKRVREGFDAIISFQPTANFYSALARLTAPSVKLVVGERTSYAAGVSLSRRVMAWCAGLLSSYVVANSFHQLSHLRSQLGLKRKAIAIWNGYQVEAAHHRRTLQDLLEKLLIVARVSPEKNGLRVMKAMKLFKDRHGWVPQLSWAGRIDKDPVSQATATEMKQFLADNPDVAERWYWLGEVKDVMRLYGEHDVLLLPSMFEGLPNAVCEAMLAGCPVIASNVCDHPRLLGESEERGLMCDPNSHVSICDAIERLNTMSSKDRRSQALRAQDFATRELSLEHMVECYEQLLVPKEAA